MDFFAELPRYIAIGAFVVFFFGFCVFIHELGHLLVALWRGLHVESFSIGFGKEIWGKTYKGVRYKVSMLPFGGYVELPQLETAEEWTDSKGNSLPAVKPIDRMLTAFAGPLFNILFGFALGSVIWIFGIEKPEPAESVKVAYVQEKSPEAEAGLKVGDEIFKVNGETFTKGFNDVFEKIILTATKEVTLTVKRAGETLDIKFVPAASEDPRFEGLGAPRFMAETGAMVESVVKDSPAARVGLKKGDIILTMNGEKVVSSSAFIENIKKMDGKTFDMQVEREDKVIDIKGMKPEKIPMYKMGMELEYSSDGFVVKSVEDKLPAAIAGIKAADKIIVLGKLKKKTLSPNEISNNITFGKGEAIDLTLERGGKKIEIVGLKPVLDKDSDVRKFRIGAILGSAVRYVKINPTPLAQLKNVLNKTWRTLKALTAKGTKVKAKHMSGPIGIAKALGVTVSHSFMYGLELVVFISFSLALMNLLPLPVLDGGHITFALTEMIVHRRLPIKVMRIIETAFAITLICFMLFVTFYDVARLTNNGAPETVTTIKI